MIEKIKDLVLEWPGDEDNFIKGPKLNPEDEFEMEKWCKSQGFNLYWTGTGYLVAIIHEDN